MSIQVENEPAAVEEATGILLERLPASKVERLLAAWRVGKGDSLAWREKLVAGETRGQPFRQGQGRERRQGPQSPSRQRGRPACRSGRPARCKREWKKRAESSPRKAASFTRRLESGSQIPRIASLISLQDKPGALCSGIEPIKRLKINMSKIDSRRSKRRAWEYFFFGDIDGHTDEESASEALAEFEKH